MTTAHTAAPNYRVFKDGKAIGTQKWRAEHDSNESTVHAGLWKGNKVVALMVAKGFYEDRVEELKDEAAFIVRACNAHDDLVKALEDVSATLHQHDPMKTRILELLVKAQS